ncbi:MAG: hypothetical protein ACK4WJ_06205 [Endomicrobiia bacterium]
MNKRTLKEIINDEKIDLVELVNSIVDSMIEAQKICQNNNYDKNDKTKQEKEEEKK